MDHDGLKALLSLLRASGVTYYEAEGVKLVLGPPRVDAPSVPPLAVKREEDPETRIDRLAFGRLFATQGVTRG